jgi:hypothetical protein
MPQELPPPFDTLAAMSKLLKSRKWDPAMAIICLSLALALCACRNNQRVQRGPITGASLSGQMSVVVIKGGGDIKVRDVPVKVYEKVAFDKARQSAIDLIAKANREHVEGTEREEFNVNGIIISKLSAPLAAGKMDADGRFKIELPGSGEYVIVAVVSDHGHNAYYWFVSQKVENGESHIHLSNANTTPWILD